MGRKPKSNVVQGDDHDDDSPIEVKPARYICVWIDREPDLPHFPPNAVMRWDLRPADWWDHWPELLAHPCAYLFAPTHPNREGPHKFADWVASWPAGLDWERVVPEQYHEKVREVLPDLPKLQAAMQPVEVDTNGAVVRYAALAVAVELESLKPPTSSEPTMFEMLIKTLLDVPESERENTARLLSTLALAPDSARTLQALKTSILKSNMY